MEYIERFSKGRAKPTIIAMGTDFKLMKGATDVYYLMAKSNIKSKSRQGILVLTKVEVIEYKLNRSGVATFNGNALKVWHKGKFNKPLTAGFG